MGETQRTTGVIVTYKPINPKSRTLLNHLLYGRIVYKNRRGKKLAYYIKGLLDNIKYSKIVTSKIFVEGEKSIHILQENIPAEYGIIFYEECDKDVSDLNLRTAKDYWKIVAEERGYIFHG